jgi:dienelactone hydrolase
VTATTRAASSGGCRAGRRFGPWLLACLLAGLASLAAAQQAVKVPSLDDTRTAQLELDALWFEAALPPGERAPAMLLLHGCGGMYARGTHAGQGRLGEREAWLAQQLNRLGVHVLVLDSLTARGESELCTQKAGTRAVTQKNRRLDALGGLQWLARQPAVDSARLGLAGWSNGGSTVLAATNGRRAEVRRAGVRASLAMAYYPGCESDLKSGYEATAPLLLLVGDLDDWTPPGPCQALAESARGAPVQLVRYAGAYHGFDGMTPLRLRRDVPNGVNPGMGVHVGAHGPSREASRERLLAFVRENWRLP